LNDQLQREMLAYYDERAEEYDQIYEGKGPAIRRFTSQYVDDADAIAGQVAEFGHGHLIDIACGTGFWAPYYARNCTQITFVDQSERMLAECKRRVEALGITNISRFIQGNIFDVALETSAYDCALVGFLLSHFTPEQEEAFFKKLTTILKPSAQLMIIDGYWSARRKGRKKEGVQERTLSNGRVFKVYKKYFDESDIKKTMTQHQFTTKSLYVGDMFIAAIAERQAAQELQL
jgi:ubiquinone/menaquinone biosynthesis C-methylase UbiE